MIDEIVDENIRKINRAVDKTFSGLSLTKWNKRKIIQDIKIKIEKKTAKSCMRTRLNFLLYK